MSYVQRIAEDWIKSRSNEGLVGGKYDPTFIIELIIESSSSWSWLIIESIIDLDSNGEFISELVNGPFESWLHRHASSSIELIEQEARDNPKFRMALNKLSIPKDPDEIWKRIEIARDGLAPL